MSLGSILGVLAGVGVSAFSKTLALLFGVGVLGVQVLFFFFSLLVFMIDRNGIGLMRFFFGLW